MKTRSKPSADSPAAEEGTRKPLESVSQPSKTFILPSRRSSDSRFVNLPDPCLGSTNRYFFCPEQGIYEFTSITAPSHHPRSILFTYAPKPQDYEAPSTSLGRSTISKAAELLVATPVDMMFFLLPILAPASSSAKQLFQPLDDLLDTQEDMPLHLRFVLYHESIRPRLEARTEAICDVVEAGDEKMFRLNEMKLVRELITKAKRMSSSKKLPASLEERFIRQALEPPLQCVMREDVVTSSNPTISSNTAGQKEESESTEQDESQSSAANTSTGSGSVSSGVSTPMTPVSPDEVIVSDPSASKSDVSELLRIRVAMSFMQQAYLPAHVSTRVDEILASPESPVDFKPLDEQLKQLANLRAEALAARSASDYTRKRATLDEETDVREARAEKKRRLEEEEKKKKAAQSRGVRDLKKVDTTGMKKMSDFFGRAGTKKS